MDMGANMFQTTNMGLAETYWYIIAAVMGFLVVVRIVNFYESHTR